MRWPESGKDEETEKGILISIHRRKKNVIRTDYDKSKIVNMYENRKCRLSSDKDETVNTLNESKRIHE